MVSRVRASRQETSQQPLAGMSKLMAGIVLILMLLGDRCTLSTKLEHPYQCSLNILWHCIILMGKMSSVCRELQQKYALASAQKPQDRVSLESVNAFQAQEAAAAAAVAADGTHLAGGVQQGSCNPHRQGTAGRFYSQARLRQRGTRRLCRGMAGKSPQCD